jgi:putative transposase
VVHSADVSERAGATPVLSKTKAAGRRLAKVWVAGGDRAGVGAWAETALGDRPEVVAQPTGSNGFAVLPRRWEVERAFARIWRYRRLRTEDDALAATRETMIWAAFGPTMLRRLATRGTS